ncbi:hypothetical protein E2562_023409 [Oryza meyeriana var. granulata]|uniref:Interferon-related developmental regulator N-terminal domain-containing protein n=1 Tax=Oryza meyeriana var. granulata TaxID=110450 RepID=A0A6G1FB06_9ORYZ|nr:hypothetical protein E2562_023409 [Oryza meyeriana var. granulata]
MVLKKFTRRTNGHASTSSSSVPDDDDTSSYSGGAVNGYCQKIQQKVSVIETVAASLHDSRASTREAALASLIGVLEGFLPAVYVGWWYGDEILGRCYVSIKKGLAKEARLALRAVALLAVTLGPCDASKKIMPETYPLVSQILEFSPDTSLVLAALECLAAVAFVDVGADDAEECMMALWEVICPTDPKVAGAANKTNPKVLVAAVFAWTLFLTTTRAWKKVSPGALRATAAYLASLLYSDSRAIRIAAGEALAVSIELKLLTRNKNTDMIFSDIEARASDLANEAARRCGDKTNFLEQIDLFKKITSFLAGGKPPEESVRISSAHYGLLTTSTWTEMIRLKFLRRFLGSGFQHHLQGKGLIWQEFVIKDDEITGKLSAPRSKRSLKKDTRIAKELNGGVSMERKEKNLQMIKNSQERQRREKKDRQMAYDMKYGSSDL